MAQFLSCGLFSKIQNRIFWDKKFFRNDIEYFVLIKNILGRVEFFSLKFYFFNFYFNSDFSTSLEYETKITV